MRIEYVRKFYEPWCRVAKEKRFDEWHQGFCPGTLFLLTKCGKTKEALHSDTTTSPGNDICMRCEPVTAIEQAEMDAEGSEDENRQSIPES